MTYRFLLSLLLVSLVPAAGLSAAVTAASLFSDQSEGAALAFRTDAW